MTDSVSMEQNMTTETHIPLKITSDESTCRYTIWSQKEQRYLDKSHGHYWHWVSQDGKLTNKQRCGTCGFVREIPTASRAEPAAMNHSKRTELEP